MDLGEFIDTQCTRWVIIRKHQWIQSTGEYTPACGVNTQTKQVIYYNTEGLKNQAEIEANFAYSMWMEYKKW